MITKSYKWHPQPSSIRKSEAAAKKANIRGATILDCFCGCGTHAVASLRGGAKRYIGTDLEDYTFCLRKEIARYNNDYNFFGEKMLSSNGAFLQIRRLINIHSMFYLRFGSDEGAREDPFL